MFRSAFSISICRDEAFSAGSWKLCKPISNCKRPGGAVLSSDNIFSSKRSAATSK
jgi:hypothetical protein